MVSSLEKININKSFLNCASLVFLEGQKMKGKVGTVWQITERKKIASLAFTGLPYLNMASIHQETLKTFQYSMDYTSPLDISMPGVRSTNLGEVKPNMLSLVQDFSIACKPQSFCDQRQNPE